MQSMIEAILLQILPPVCEMVWVCSAYYGDRLMYAKHVLLHCLVIPLLDLIQGPDHGIIVPLVAKCSLCVHQQVPHRDVLTFVQRAGPFTRIPTKTGEDVGAHTGLIILLQKGIHVEMPERVRHFCPWIGRLEDRHIQSHWPQPFSFPAPPAASVHTPATHHLARSGVSVGVWCSLSGEEGGEPPPPTIVHWVLGSLPRGHTAPARPVGLASVLSPLLHSLGMREWSCMYSRATRYFGSWSMCK